MRLRTKIGLVLLTVALMATGKYVYDRHINHNFMAITEGKVYKSGVIPPDEIKDYVEAYGIKSIVDLRFPGTGDTINNPELPEELIAERDAVAKIKGVKYFNNGSDQVPNEENLKTFLPSWMIRPIIRCFCIVTMALVVRKCIRRYIVSNMKDGHPMKREKKPLSQCSLAHLITAPRKANT
ncbi:hypothetical protein [Flavobacterium sp.]|jgi:hypothetical protein|uniref:hypothetical protein n=1 Tax=Flavobacterium sp. TaxID=239 RepID=UPI0022C9F22C|nr:hypothetical protein [Flavobacterium sp.]MCZ8145793.1 hypothetical protein [Flavobacterium sp.]MCZ8366379.1 hypothetical protein [Flavobacterium sp.]